MGHDENIKDKYSPFQQKIGDPYIVQLVSNFGQNKLYTAQQSGKALYLHSEGQGFDLGGRSQKYHNSRLFCSLYDEILNYDISDFNLQDRTLAFRSANRELYHFATRYATYFARNLKQAIQRTYDSTVFSFVMIYRIFCNFCTKY